MTNNRLGGAKSTAHLARSKIHDLEGRPTTAGVSSQIMSDATAAFTGDMVSHLDQAAQARAISVSRLTRFTEKERSVKKLPYPSFYVKSQGQEEYQEVLYHQENRFEGKSCFSGNIATGQVVDQELEKFFIDAAHKELQEKRRDEEGREMLREWGMARGRVEAEIARRKEHNTEATNFKEARGWVRGNW